MPAAVVSRALAPERVHPALLGTAVPQPCPLGVTPLTVPWWYHQPRAETAKCSREPATAHPHAPRRQETEVFSSCH